MLQSMEPEEMAPAHTRPRNLELCDKGTKLRGLPLNNAPTRAPYTPPMSTGQDQWPRGVSLIWEAETLGAGVEVGQGAGQGRPPAAARAAASGLGRNCRSHWRTTTSVPVWEQRFVVLSHAGTLEYKKVPNSSPPEYEFLWGLAPAMRPAR